MATLAVVGATMMDMIAYVDRVPGAGETIVGSRFALGFGGKGANQAVAAARFGATVSMINAVGNDDFGAMHIANFSQQSVDAAHVMVKTGSSGVAPIWVEPNGTNRIIIVPGANDALLPHEAAAAVATIPDLRAIVGQLEIPQSVTTAAFAQAKNLGAITVLNPAPATTISQELLAVTDWLIPNEVEFEMLHPRSASPNSDESILAFVHDYGVRLCVTLGNKGAALATKDNEVVRIPAPQVNAVDTTGAGDCFVGAFVHGLMQGLTEERAVALACNAASLSVQRHGTQTSFPTYEEAAAMFKEQQ